ncbi:PDDEXK nuclease domain-containing protein [Egbenema bharatensis]|uniref:PDDEXK nuclease domain-containing protein n=1 Tax=Egbenema bharatensis TaxID=3463334 RepID=UPI003A88F8F5
MSNDLAQPGDLLFQEIGQLIDAAKQRAAAAINAEITLLYWQVGHRIQTEVLQGQRAEYGKQVIGTLSRRLTQAYGKGWGERQLHYCVMLASVFPDREILHTVCSKLSWSHLRLLISIDDPLKRDFLREIEQFLLELGAGFTFVARQKRLQIDNDDFYINLLFYNRKLKRLVAIELKLGAFRPEHKSQMELYLRWLAKYEQERDELPPLGIILCAGKKQEQIELLELDKSGIHVTEYLTVLPPKEVLQNKLHEAIVSARRRLLPSQNEPS